jgi:hypothetical protein
VAPIGPVGPMIPTDTIAKITFVLFANPVVPVPAEVIRVTGTST